MTAIWLPVLIAGVVATAVGSRRAVADALVVSDVLGVSHGLVGLMLLSIGTDLPEIANSISASMTGHGDVNVGDSTGSALTQITLILAILILAMPAIAERDHDDDRALIVPIGIVTALATLTITALISDGRLSRLDGAVLVSIWGASMIVAARHQRLEPAALAEYDRPPGRVRRHIATLMAWLAVVAVGATAVVQSFVRLTDAIGVPELIASTIVLAIGTSLPELVVDWTAIRTGAVALAFGDLFGSSLVDSSLSIGIGPLIVPTAVSDEALGSVLVVTVGIVAATAVTWWGRHAGRRLAMMLLVVYGVCTGAMIALTSA
jgi:cation:H+ antiporter